MGEFDVDLNVQYTNWENKKAKKLAKKSDKDGQAGLNTVEEILKFFGKVQNKNVNINEIFGLELSNKARKSSAAGENTGTDYSELINYFNSLDYDTKNEITYRANDIGRDLLYQLEKDINTAFENCEGYKLIKLKRDRFDDKVRFNLEEVQKDVITALNSVNTLQTEIEQAYDTAKGTEGTEPKYEDYNEKLAEIAHEKLGMSYDEFIEKNKDHLGITTSITEKDAIDSSYEYAEFYKKARTYVKEIKKLARETLQKTRTESGERLLNETVKYSDSMIDLIDFAYEDTNTASIDALPSDIMRRAFLEAVNENSEKTDIQTPETEKSTQKNKKVLKNHNIIIKTPNSEYDINGTKK